MTSPENISWEPCEEDGCIGVRLAATSECLAHAGNDQRDAALRQLGVTGEIDARGVTITEALLMQILAAAPEDADASPTFTAAKFDAAIFEGRAWFNGATFKGPAWFRKATFEGDAWFGTATFEGDAWFAETTFGGRTWFAKATFEHSGQFSKATFQSLAVFAESTFRDGAEFREATFRDIARFDRASFEHSLQFRGTTFKGPAWFREATFQGRVGFREATFQVVAGFIKATFQDDVEFFRATFQDLARFDEATFQGAAEFIEAIFQRAARFDGVTFERAARFDGAIFERARQVGPLLAYRGLVLDDVHFAQPVRIEASTVGMCCRRARFADGVQFRLRWASVLLDDADLAAPSILAGTPRLSDDTLAIKEERIARAWRRLLAEEISERPRLLSLQRADVAGLGLSSVELADCQFAGAHNLDKLRLEADVSFAAAPVRLRWDWRQVIAEERAWRAHHSRPWSSPWSSPLWPAWAGKRPAVPEAGQIAGLYRALRKGREDTKDEPGAADFYYGEMEMRRHARRGRTGGASRGWVERTVLTAYWLVSGYALRAWRALATFAALLLVSAVLFTSAGFADPATTTATTSPPTTSVAASTSTTHRGASPPTPTTGSATSPPTSVPTTTRATGDTTFGGALVYGARTVIGLTREPQPRLTRFGDVLQILLRILGPVLLGLAVLSIRGRVKR